ncbi:MFS transporter prlG [Vanrija pseudolonga]|uniref:MFS transporter prlG n=1 Tax=Vanrija pseudolonga TaxID=143232 RepID=A0AAF0Y533_9TREE|nr:MFS transporter prlG [Vanrija pseudolonga]
MPATDVERVLSPPVGAVSPTMRTFPRPRDDDDVSAHELDEHEPEPIPIVPLKQSSTVLSTRSARDAARALESFESSPENPRNWTPGRKWRTTLTVALTGFISTCGSSIAVPGVHAVMAEFGEHNTKIGVLITSFYVLGLGSGPFLFAPISELYGRQVAYHTSQTFFVIFCIGTAVAPTMAGLIAMRFVCGVFGSVGPALGVATCADIFAPKERGRPVSIYALGPMSGPVLGSMLGYWILFGGWRWLFWSMTFMALANWALLISLTDETFAPVIHKKLQYRIKHPQADATGFLDRLNPRRILHNLGWMTAMVSSEQARAVFGRAFSRPPRLLFTNPVAFIFSAYYAYIYGIIYLFLVTVPLLFGSAPFKYPGLFSYEWPQSTLSLSYLGLAVGFLTSATLAATTQDRIYRYLSAKYKDDGQPEYRLVLTQIGMIIMPIGLLVFGWTAHAHTHWIGPLAGQALIALGLMLAFNSIQTYLVDAFFPYSAAATAGATALRSVIACVLPIFCPQMFGTLDWGWGGTLLALVAVIAVPAPLVMFKYGRRLRERFLFEG